MNKAEVTELLKIIKRCYSNFQVPTDIDSLRKMVNEWYESLRDVSFELANANLRNYVVSEDWPPSIARLSCPLNHYYEVMRDTAINHMRSIGEFEQTTVSPSEKQQERMREIFAKRRGHRNS